MAFISFLTVTLSPLCPPYRYTTLFSPHPLLPLPSDASVRRALDLRPVGRYALADALWLYRAIEGTTAVEERLCERLEAHGAALAHLMASSHSHRSPHSPGMSRSPLQQRGRNRGARSGGRDVERAFPKPAPPHASTFSSGNLHGPAAKRAKGNPATSSATSRAASGATAAAAAARGALGYAATAASPEHHLLGNTVETTTDAGAGGCGEEEADVTQTHSGSSAGRSGGIAATPAPLLSEQHAALLQSQGALQKAEVALQRYVEVRQALFQLSDPRTGGSVRPLPSAAVPATQATFTEETHLPLALTLASAPALRGLLGQLRPHLQGSATRNLLARELARAICALRLIQWAKKATPASPGAEPGTPGTAERLLKARAAALRQLIAPEPSTLKLLADVRKELERLGTMASSLHSQVTELAARYAGSFE